ncbi:MAG: hypothetical protein DWQ08_14835 [Proteobacteria bacterium]|nr:MAG: hypothetical protein DWQ08_14835 [Pseudomonadota bacterium]
MTKLKFLIIPLALFLFGCDHDSSSSSGGSSSKSGTISANVGGGSTGGARGKFNLVFDMTYQSCGSCGIWFDSARLVIEHSKGTFTARQSGSLLIKRTPYRQGRFVADLGAIPASATIKRATLYMMLNRHEGIANSDRSSKIAVYGYVGGSRQFVREISAARDIKGRGYSKSNPNVPIDFTAYARKL